MKVINTQQRSEAWYQARRGLPTCSRFDAILTPKTGKPSAGQDKLINELIAEAIIPPEAGLVRSYVSAEMEQGMILEGEARCAFELQYAAAPVHQVGFVLHDSGAFGGSPDALVGEHSGVEIKCPQAATHVGYVRAGELPTEYKCQVHGYMIVTGRSEWEFFSYARNFPPLRVLVRRDDFTTALDRELIAFVDRLNSARKQFNLPKLGETT